MDMQDVIRLIRILNRLVIMENEAEALGGSGCADTDRVMRVVFQIEFAGLAENLTSIMQAYVQSDRDGQANGRL